MDAQIAAMPADHQQRNRSRGRLQRQPSDVAMSNAEESTTASDNPPASGVAPGTTPIVWRCPFDFLGCVHIAVGLPQWDQHYQWHTVGQLPRYLECPFIGCSWSCRTEAFGHETWEKRLLHILEAHRSGGTIRMAPSRDMVKYLFEEGMLSDEQARDFRQQGYLDEEMVTLASDSRHNQTHDPVTEISIRPSRSARLDRSPNMLEPSQVGTEAASASKSDTDVEPASNPKEASPEPEILNGNIMCFSAAQDDSTMPAWSPTAPSVQHQAEIADLFALRAAIWHMTRRATDLSNTTNLQALDTEATSLRPVSLSQSNMNDYVATDVPANIPQTAIMRRNSWSGPFNKSEVPDTQGRPSSTCPGQSRQWLEGTAHIANTQGAGSGDGSRRTNGGHLRSLSSNGRTIGNYRRRAADDEDEGNADRDRDGRGKRPRLDDSFQKPQVRIRLPCIFNMGEPDAFPKHTTTYEHISELLRHLTKHGFHACQKCFTRFNNAAETVEHICKKTCPNTACRRTVLLNTAQPLVCDCIITAVEQWQHLFALQYPGQPAPTLQTNIFDDAVTTPSLQPHTPFQSGVPEIAAAEFDNNVSSMSNTNLWAPRAFDPTLTQVHASRTALPVMRTDLGHAFQKEYQQLSERLADLERLALLERQKDNASSKREEVLETLLLSVWEAFCETGSHKTRIDGPLWRMIRRDAPEILHQTAAGIGPSSTLPGQLLQNGDMGQHFEVHHTSTNGNFAPNGDSDWMMHLAATGDFSNASAHPNAGYSGI